MDYTEIAKTIEEHKGVIDHGINWTWVHFPSEADCRECFAKIKNHIEHRGIYTPCKDSGDDWAFRFR